MAHPYWPERHDATPEPSLSLHRLLQDGGQREMLYVIYLVILGCCCISPILYYLRLYLWQRQQWRRLQRLEQAGLVAALQSTINSSTEALNSVREERKARILQLMKAVQWTLREDDFRRVDALGRPLDDGKEAPTKPPMDTETGGEDIEASQTSGGNEEETLQVRVPLPGLISSKPSETRWVPGTCSICLSHYQPGQCVAVSSNACCEHVFHQSPCLENWLVRLAECPVCRRSFLIDPYDIEDGLRDNKATSSQSNDDGGDNLQEPSPPPIVDVSLDSFPVHADGVVVDNSGRTTQAAQDEQLPNTTDTVDGSVPSRTVTRLEDEVVLEGEEEKEEVDSLVSL